MTLENAIRAMDVSGLKDTFRGQVLLPSDGAYDTYRRVWNAMIDRRPAVILRCADTRDVAAAVRFARDRDLLVSVRGGGHNVAGLAVCDDGVMIDLSGMRNVAVDPFTTRAFVQGGATWKDVDLTTQRHGLAVTGGHVGSTGVGGLTLGGGFGWLHGKLGLTSDNLVAAEVVTADGKIVRAGEDSNADLFWALRGGGGNFGVVTSFEFELHAIDDVFVGAFFWPRDRAADLIDAYEDFTTKAPDALTTAFGISIAEEGNELIPPEFHGETLAFIFTAYPGASAEEGERAVQPLRDLGPVGEMVTPMPYTDLQLSQDALWRPGMSFYWKSGQINTLGDGAGKAILDSAPGTYLTALIQLGGAISHLPDDATAYAHRDARFQYLVAQLWEDPAEADDEIATARRSYQMVEPHVAGAFVNFLTSDDIEERVDDALGSHARRLATIKKQYDPDNFFRLNANIKPA